MGLEEELITWETTKENNIKQQNLQSNETKV